MRLFAIAAFAGLAIALAAPASAAPVSVAPVTIEATLQKKFDDDYGAREIAVLQRMVTASISRELTQSGATVGAGAPVTVETTLVNVKPSKPTFQQAVDRPGLDIFRSISLGGAELRARIVGADGATLGEVTYKWYEYDLYNSFALTTWSDAQRAINIFAHRVADAYVAHAPS